MRMNDTRGSMPFAVIAVTILLVSVAAGAVMAGYERSADNAGSVADDVDAVDDALADITSYVNRGLGEKVREVSLRSADELGVPADGDRSELERRADAFRGMTDEWIAYQFPIRSGGAVATYVSHSVDLAADPATVDSELGMDGYTPAYLRGKGTITVVVESQSGRAETDIEVDVSSKSNNLLGPGLTLSVTNRNMFKRAENFSISLTGSYEWQIGGNKQATGNTGLLNSYELGVNASLSVPRLLFPRFREARRDRSEQTNFQVGSDLMNRHNYFRMISFWGSATYDFNSSLRNYHSVVPFRLNYTYLLKTSVAFDSVTVRNPSVAQSFSNQFIPSMSYTYTYDRPVTYRNPNRFYWQTSITQAGNIIAGLQKLFGNDKKEGKLFINNRYSQFLKLTSELITYKSFDNNNQLAFRLMGGIGYAYGNSSVMPYSEQFYIGGANSIRAFQVRNIGPGSYHPEETQYSYLDQTGDIKLEANLEYRFTIYEKFKGAFFFDAGNVWLLNREEERPGGEFNLKGFFKELAFGTGLGLRYDFSFLVVRADLGIPLHAPYDTSKSGYYNIDGKFLKNLLLNIAIGYPF